MWARNRDVRKHGRFEGDASRRLTVVAADERVPLVKGPGVLIRPI